MQYSRIYTLEQEELSRFLERRRWERNFNFEINFDDLFQQILAKANEFVPSEAGSILLDDPRTKDRNQPATSLVFIACFGDKSDAILGRTIDSNVGIAGKTYITGKSFKSDPDTRTQSHYRAIDQEIGYQTNSVVSVPIIIEKSVCGVLELVNRKDSLYYSDRELELLQIFAGYISTSIQNALETKRSKELSKMDDLTGLYNDRYFHYVVQQEIINIGTEYDDLCLIFIDLDHFKQINDHHGHLAGSRTLSEVGELLRSVVTQPEVTLARYGGDEFVVVLPNTSLDETIEIAEMIRKGIEAKTFLTTKSEKSPALNIKNLITASIGVASFRDHLTEPGGIHDLHNQLVYLADQAMYAAKEQGKNRVVGARSEELQRLHTKIKKPKKSRAKKQRAS